MPTETRPPRAQHLSRRRPPALTPSHHAAQLSGAGIWLRARSGVCYLRGMFNSWGRRKAGSGAPLLPQPLDFQCPSVPKWVRPLLLLPSQPDPGWARGWGRARRADPAAGHPGGAAARGPGTCLPHSLQRATVLTEPLLTRQAFVPAAQRCLSGALNRIKSCNQTHARTQEPSWPQSQGCCGAARLSPVLPPELGVCSPHPGTYMKLLVLLVCSLPVWRAGETRSDAPGKLSLLAPGGN